MNIDFDKEKMIKLKETVEYYGEHKEEVKADIKEAIAMAKELGEFVENEVKA
jgi:hypothetical protein